MQYRITQQDFLLANRRAARQEDIDAHGRPTIFHNRLHRSHKAYNRKKFKHELLQNLKEY